MREPMAVVLQKTANAIGERPRDRRLERVENIGTSHCADCKQGEPRERARAKDNCKVGSGCWAGGDLEARRGRFAKAVVVFVQMGGMWLREVAAGPQKPTTNQEEHRKVAAKQTRIQALVQPSLARQSSWAIKPGHGKPGSAQWSPANFQLSTFPSGLLSPAAATTDMEALVCATVSQLAAAPLSHETVHR